MSRALLLSALVAIPLLAGCDDAETRRVDETRSRLVGSWLREADVAGASSRRVLTLGKDSRFVDRVVVSRPGEASERRELAGEWSYDGTNLKRRFLQENGRQFAGGGMRFATFPLVSVADSEMVLSDNIEGRQVTYRRVAEGTQP